MTRHTVSRSMAALALVLVMLAGTVPALAAGTGFNARLKMALSTRTGPGTRYDEPGTFFKNNWSSTSVRVLSRAWDSQNDIWWVQVEFGSGRQKIRAYTGLKRVDIDISHIPDEHDMGTATMVRSATAYWGPGTDYVSSKYDIPSGAAVTICDVEAGYAQVEFYDSRVPNPRRRAWTPTGNLSGNWGSGVSGGYRSVSGRSDKWEAIVSAANADSWLTSSKDPYAYLPEKMIDGLDPTAWQFSTQVSPLGQSCAYFTFSTPVDVDEIWIKNGFWKITADYDQYWRNSRPASIAISYMYNGGWQYTDESVFSLGDYKSMQTVRLGPHYNVTGIRLRILSIYTGERFPNDVCISEVRFIRTPSLYGY